MEPQDHPRRILLAVTGLSPQIVTETLYALAVACRPTFTPTEIHLITTAEGADRGRLSLLHPKTGWFHRLRRDYRLPEIAFGEPNIHLLREPDGQPLADIRTPRDNARAADAITALVCELTADPDSALHVSIAGGRKTMGFYLGYALSLYGRSQDRLSHVLVSAPYESHRKFFYPTPDSEVIHTPDGRPYDTREAVVTLAEIPFVSLRHGLDERLLQGETSFSESVATARRNLGPPELVIDLEGRRVGAGGVVFALPPADVAFLAWFARRAQSLSAGICRTDISDDELQEFLDEYRGLRDELSGDVERVEDSLNDGMDEDYFDQRKSKLNGKFVKKLGKRGARDYLIQSDRKRPRSRYALGLAREAIRFEPIPDPNE